VLVASGVAVSRLASDDHSRPGRSEAASPAPRGSGPLDTPEPVASGHGAGAPIEAAGGVGGAATAAPVPSSGAGPARRHRLGGAPSSSPTTPPASGEASPSAGAASAATAPAPGGRATPEPTSGSGGSSAGGGPPPGTQGEPQTAPLLSVTVSAGQGATGGVVGAGFADGPDADVTVGTTHVVGDAPPSRGTAIGLGSRFFHPPPSVPVLPG